MNYTKIKNKDGSIKFDVVLKGEEFRKYFDEVVAYKIGEVEVKGFRKGHTPKDIAIAYVDKDKAFTEAAEKAVRISLKKITVENNLTLVTPPEVKLLEDKENLHYEVTVVALPEVILGDFKKDVALSNEIFYKELENISVADEEIQKAVEWLINSRKEFKEEAKKNETILTDEMAQKIGDFKTAHDLKESIKEGIEAEKKIREADKNRARIIDTLISKTLFDLPDMLINKTMENLKNDLKNSLESGKIDYSEYIKKNYESEKKLEESLKKQAEKELRAHLVLETVAKELDIKVEDNEIEEEMNKIFIKQPEVARKNINLQQLKDFSYGTIKNRKIFKALENIKI